MCNDVPMRRLCEQYVKFHFCIAIVRTNEYNRTIKY